MFEVESRENVLRNIDLIDPSFVNTEVTRSEAFPSVTTEGRQTDVHRIESGFSHFDMEEDSTMTRIRINKDKVPKGIRFLLWIQKDRDRLYVKVCCFICFVNFAGSPVL